MNCSKNAPRCSSTFPRVQQRADLRRERRRLEGLREVARRALAERGVAALVVATGREHDHRQLAEALVRPDEAQDLDPVHVGHVEVEQHEIDRGDRQSLDRLEPARRLVEAHVAELAQ
jgi:hypothetical protein